MTADTMLGAPGSVDYGRFGALAPPSDVGAHNKLHWVKHLKLTLQGAVLMDLKEEVGNLHLVLPGSGRATL